jgi:hypothetical protein
MIFLTPQRLLVAAAKQKDFDLLFDYLLGKSAEYLISIGEVMEPLDDIIVEVELWMKPWLNNWEYEKPENEYKEGEKRKRIFLYDYKTRNVIQMVGAIDQYNLALTGNDSITVSRLTYTIVSYAIAASHFDHEEISTIEADQHFETYLESKSKAAHRSQIAKESAAEKIRQGEETRARVRKEYDRLMKSDRYSHRDTAAIIAGILDLTPKTVRAHYKILGLS